MECDSVAPMYLVHIGPTVGLDKCLDTAMANYVGRLRRDDERGVWMEEGVSGLTASNFCKFKAHVTASYYLKHD